MHLLTKRICRQTELWVAWRKMAGAVFRISGAMGKKGFLLLFGFLLLVLSALPSHARIRLMVWGLQSSEESKGQDAVVREFERRHPNIKVTMLSMGAGGMDPQKLMTSIAAEVPPDVIHQDRFTIGDWASRGAFMPLDDFLKKDPGPIRKEDYFPACWAEAEYQGKVYAIPYGTDDRALYYNRALFREAGLDPDRPPRTWDELLQYALRLTRKNPDGSFQRIGFIPNYGNSWLYLYSWQNGGEFMSPDGRRCTLCNPRTAEALRYMVKVYDALGGVEKVNAFQSGFQGAELDPFFIGKVAMKIDGNWVLNNIARYAPDLDFGVAPAPVPAARLRGEPPFRGQPKFITWSGGFSFAIPVGAKHPKEAWEFIKWMNSVEAALLAADVQRKYNLSKGRPFVPGISANKRVVKAVMERFAPRDPRLRRALQTFVDLMPYSRFRPVTFVGQRLWDEHVRAFELATRHKATPEQALAAGQRVVQKELDKVFNRTKFPLLDWRYPIAILAASFIGLVLAVWMLARRSGRVSRLMRSEVRAGYLFAMPWIAGFLFFTLGPIVASAILSFCDYDVLHPPRFVGWQNYKWLLSPQDDWPVFWHSLRNAAFLAVVGIPLTMATSLSIALLLNTKVKGMTWYRTIYFVPSIVPIVAGAILWIWVLNPDYGLVNAAWKATLGQWFGWPAPTWLASEVWSKPALILLSLWGAGGGMILWLAGLQGVPQQLYEAAELDGAGWWAKFRNVTLPMISPYIFFNLIMGTIGVLQTFDTVYIMTGQPAGGPADSTLVPVVLLFQNGFQYFKMGFASALAWLLFAIILTLSLIQLKMGSLWVYYEAERGK